MRDLLDVLLVASLFYFLLASLGRARARAFLLVLGAVGVLHLLARTVGLHLSSMLMGAGLWIVALIAVIAFQDDIRRSLHRITAWRLLGGRGNSAESSSRMELGQSVARMAERRVGALIVVPGQETLQPHVTGGLRLEGRLSGPLLESIFSPDSPGHDGAVIVENGMVRRFGVHLPLSQRLEEIGRLGTRHTAALGLSEQCDALVIVVSEERGEISIALNGMLIRNLSRSELESYLGDHGNHDTQRRRSSTVIRRTASRLALALGAATLLWFALVFQEGTVQQTIDVALEYKNVPAELALLDPKPSRVRVTVSGRRAAFQELAETQVGAALDLSEAQAGFHRLAIDQADVTLPATLDVLEIEPPVVSIRLTEKR